MGYPDYTTFKRAWLQEFANVEKAVVPQYFGGKNMRNKRIHLGKNNYHKFSDELGPLELSIGDKLQEHYNEGGLIHIENQSDKLNSFSQSDQRNSETHFKVIVVSPKFIGVKA